MQRNERRENIEERKEKGMDTRVERERRWTREERERGAT